MTRIALHIEPVLKNTPVDRVTWGDLQRLKNSIKGGGNTILGVFRMLNKPFAAAVARKMIKENPLATISLPSGKAEERTPLTHGQVVQLLEMTKGSYWEDHLHLFVATGMRLAELLGLEWRDIRLDDAEPHLVVRQIAHDRKDGIAAGFGPPKTRAGRRRIDLAPEMVERLRTRLERRQGKPDQLVFPNRAGLQQDGATIRHFLKNRARALGVEKLYPHLLRHTMISHALQMTGDLGGVSVMAGHSSPRITAGVYLKGLPGAGRKIAGAMSTLFSAPKEGAEGAARVQNQGMLPVWAK
jgi:integrase